MVKARIKETDFQMIEKLVNRIDKAAKKKDFNQEIDDRGTTIQDLMSVALAALEEILEQVEIK